MKEFFEAVANMPKPKPKIHTVCIAGQNVVVSLKKKLEVMANGEDKNYWVTPIEFELKPIKKAKGTYTVLRRAEKGYAFVDKDIHWPNKIVEGGYAWVRDKE